MDPQDRAQSMQIDGGPCCSPKQNLCPPASPDFCFSPLVAQLVKYPPACGRPGFDPWVDKIPCRRERLPTPVFWSGEFRGLYSPWSHRESDMTKRLALSFVKPATEPRAAMAMARDAGCGGGGLCCCPDPSSSPSPGHLPPVASNHPVLPQIHLPLPGGIAGEQGTPPP